MSDQEKEILAQEADDEALEEVTGGFSLFGWCDGGHSYDPNVERCDGDCVQTHKRSIYLKFDAFPNCAATVEDGSWCHENDACVTDAVYYYNMKECAKAWK